MGKRLISLLVGLSFCIEVTGVDYLPNFSSDMSYALRPMAAAVSENIKRIELKEGIGYETEELPLDLMQQLPGLKKNERIAKIRIARGMIAAQVYKEAGLASSTYTHIENTDSLPSPRNLYKISRVLKIDPILIIEGKEWNEVVKYRKDRERMRLLRLRKGKTQLDIVKDLEETGLQLETDRLGIKRTRYSNWERKKAIPFYGDRVIIAKVLGDDTLFNLPAELKGDIELKIMPGVPIHTKALFGLAFYWKRIRGCTPREVAKVIGVKNDSFWSTMRRYGKEEIAGFYGIILPEKSKRLTKKRELLKAEVDQTGWRYLPGVRKTIIHRLIAQHWKEISGKTIPQLAHMLDVPACSVRHFFKANCDAVEFYGILPPKIRGIPLVEKGLIAKTKPAEIEKPLPETAVIKPEVSEVKPPEVKPEAPAEKPKKPKVEIKKPAVEPKKPKVEVKKPIVELREAIMEPELTEKDLPAIMDDIKGMFEKKELSIAGGEKAGVEKLFSIGGDKEDIKPYYSIHTAYTTYNMLRSEEDRELVDGEDIEEAITLLEESLFYDYLGIKAIPKEGPAIEEDADVIRLWNATRCLLQIVKLLVSTELCDWDEPEIRKKANDITKGLAEDLDKAKRIEDWVIKNIGFALGYGGYWNATASETLVDFSRGMCLNRANLIVAMLRSIGIQARYRIMYFKREMVKEMIPPVSYDLVGETTEHIVAQAFVDYRWINLAGEAFMKDRWVDLKKLQAEEIGESEYVYNIDGFARKKAEKGSRRARDKMEDYRIRELAALYHPDNILKTFREKEGNLSWDRIPAVWLESDIEVLVNELARLRGKVKVLTDLLDMADFKEPVFKTASGSRVPLDGLISFIKEKYELLTGQGALSKIREMLGIEKGSWNREDWQEVKKLLCSDMKAADSESIKTQKDLEDYLYSRRFKEIVENKLADLMDRGKGNKAALTALLMANYEHIKEYADDCCKHFPRPPDPVQLMHYILKQLGKELLLFDYEKENLSDFITRKVLEITEAYMTETPRRGKSRRAIRSSSAGMSQNNPYLLQEYKNLKAISQAA